MSDIYKELERLLIEGKISPDEFVDKYNAALEAEQERHREVFKPHENI